MSYALAFNSYSGANASLGFVENKNTQYYQKEFCLVFAAAVQHVLPGFAEFNCDYKF